MAEFASDIGLGISVFATSPGVINPVIGIREVQATVTLAAQFIRGGCVDVACGLRIEKGQARRHSCVVGWDKMADGAIDVRPDTLVCGESILAEQEVTRGKEVAECLGLAHTPRSQHGCGRMASDTILSRNDVGGTFSRMRLTQFRGDIELGVGMRACSPLAHLRAMAGGTLLGRGGLGTGRQCEYGQDAEEGGPLVRLHNSSQDLNGTR